MNILDFIFPKACFGCGKPNCYFCPTCLAKIKRVPQICPVCEKPSPFGETHPGCRSRYSLDGLVSFLVYDGTARQAIHKLKYRLVTDLKDELFRLIFQDLSRRKEFLALNKFIIQYQPVILPIPLYWYKYNFRGFNQAALFGQALAQKFKLPLSEKILVRKRATTSQTKLTIEERRKNVADAFAVSPIIHNSQFHILLIDDVWTTGATLKTAGDLLKRKGAKKVWGLTLAK